MPKDSRPNEGAHSHDDRELDKVHPQPAAANAFVKENVDAAVDAASAEAEAAGVAPSAVMYSAPEGYGLGHGAEWVSQKEADKPAGRVAYEEETASKYEAPQDPTDRGGLDKQ